MGLAAFILAAARRAPRYCALVSLDRYLLAMRVGDLHYGIDASLAAEVVRVGPLTRLPGAPPFLPGVFHHRSEVLPALDLRGLVAPGSPGPPARRAVLVESGGMRVAVLGDGIGGLVPLSGAAPPPAGTPAYVEAMAASALGPVAVLDAGLLLEVARRDARLVPENRSLDRG